MEEKKEILRKAAKEYFCSAEDELAKERYNAAVVLYFKALVAVADYHLLIKLGKAPSSHTKRFSVTREKFPEVYNLLDKDFPFYQKSYVQLMTKELAEVIKDDVKTLAVEAEIVLQ